MIRLVTLLLAAVTLGTAAPAGAQTESQRAQWAEWTEAYLRAEPSGQKFGGAWIERARSLREQRFAAEARVAGAPGPPPGMYDMSGTFLMPVLAGAYSDVTPSYTPAQYEDAFFGPGSPTRYSLSRFFEEASGGAFTFDGIVVPWITLDQTRAYYMQDDPLRGRFVEYMYDVVVRADAFVDWAQFDNDGPDGVPNSGDDDGEVDMVTFMHPLADGVCRQDALGGPVATGFRLQYLGAPFNRQPFTTSTMGANGQPLVVNDFILSAGLACNGTSIATMNINIHEMGHALGLPDLNDLDRSSYGVGNWDVMGYGLYATEGRPAQLGAWSRRQLGWTTVENVTESASFVLEPAVLERRALRLDICGTNQYYLIENRQRVLADAGLPGEGLVVWHVDDDVLLPAVQAYRGTENEEHPGLAVLQADGLNDLAAKRNTGDGGDPFPGTSGVDIITDDTPVDLRGYGGSRSGFAVAAIIESGQQVSFDVIADTGPLSVEPTQDLPEATLGQIGYDAQLSAGGGSCQLTWTATSPLPDGLTLSADGRVTGDPRALEPTSFTFTVSDEFLEAVEGSATLSVVVPTFSDGLMLESLLGGAGLGADAVRALDLLGNRNGRLDIGDVLLELNRIP